VDLELTVRNQDGEVCCPATVTLELPLRAPREPRDHRLASAGDNA
jgi:hypothetical protein